MVRIVKKVTHIDAYRFRTISLPLSLCPCRVFVEIWQSILKSLLGGSVNIRFKDFDKHSTFLSQASYGETVGLLLSVLLLERFLNNACK